MWELIIQSTILFLWIITVNLISGWSILILFYKDYNTRFNNLELFAYSFSLGTVYISILGFILDLTIGINIITVITPTFALILISIILRKKSILEQNKVNTPNKYRIAVVIIFIVVAFGLILRMIPPILNQILMAWDTWYWLNVSKNVAFTGHSLITFKPLYPSGYAYITGIVCLTNPEFTYIFIQAISIFLYFPIGCISVICISNKISGKSKIYSLFSGLIFSSSYLLVSFGMLGLPQNIAYSLIPVSLLFFSQRGVQRFLGALILSGIYIIHTPSALIMLISIGLFGALYMLTNRECIRLKETKIILLLILALTIITVIIIFTIFPQIITYFINFSFYSSATPGLLYFLFYSSGFIVFFLTVLGAVYSLREKIVLSNLFFTLFFTSFIFSQLPGGTLGIPWAPVRYLMYMSTAATAPAALGFSKAVHLINKYGKNNFIQPAKSIFIIFTVLFQTSIGLTAFLKNGGWDYAINNYEYSTLKWMGVNTDYNTQIIVYPGIHNGMYKAAKAFLNPRLVVTNTTHIYNESAVNETVLSDILISNFHYIILNSSQYPVLNSLLEGNSSFQVVYTILDIRVFKF